MNYFFKAGTLLAILIVAGSMLAGSVKAQNSSTVTANASGHVAKPICIAVSSTSNTSLRLGTFVTDASTSGTVTIAATSGGTRSKTGGVTLNSADAGGSCLFNVTGESGYAYNQTGDASCTLAGPSSHSITVTLSVSGSNPRTLTSGADSFYAGGTTNSMTSSNTPNGDYSGSFHETAAYN